MKLVAKDFYYIIAILILSWIYTFVLFFGENSNQIVSYVGFASSIISIILSILAVIYMFYQSGETISNFNKMSEVSNNLTKIAGNFEDTTNQLAASLESISNVEQNVSIIKESLESFKTTEASDTVTDGSNQASLTIDNIKSLMSTSSTIGLMSLYYVTKLHKTPISKNINEIAKEANEKAKRKWFLPQYMAGFASAISNIGVYEMDVLSTDFNFSVQFKEEKFSEFESALMDALSQRSIEKTRIPRYMEVLDEIFENN